MKYTLTIHEEHLNALMTILFSANGSERGAYLYCGISKTTKETRFIVNNCIGVREGDIVDSSLRHISIRSRSYVGAIVESDRQKNTLFFVHNHPAGYEKFSQKDKIVEKEFVRVISARSSGFGFGSLVLSGTNKPMLRGRFWVSQNHFEDLQVIRVVGKRLRIFRSTKAVSRIDPWADRQVRAFGRDFQSLIGHLHIGVVGVGGTGSAVCEQLLRMGVGELTVIDNQQVEDTNITRLHESTKRDIGKPKINIIRRLAREIGFGTNVHTIMGSIYTQKNVQLLRNCDLIFCCTDDSFGRSILNRLAIWYLIPVIDIAVQINSENGTVRGVEGRVTKLFAGNACLHCREELLPERIRAESIAYSNPKEYAKLKKERYVVGMDEPDPSVIMLTTHVASRGVIEFVQMLTGFLGDRETTEIRELYSETQIGKNSRSGKDGCECMDKKFWGKGDKKMFLGMLW